MTLALNEVDAMGKKAARGAGFSWGMAEEAGKAARWLCARGVDGVAALRLALAHVDGTDPPGRGPATLEGNWSAARGDLCPLMTGAALADAARLWVGTGKRIAAIVAPVLLLPFVAMAAGRAGRTIAVEWAGVRALTDGRDLQLSGAGPAVMAEVTARVAVLTGGVLTDPRPIQTRANPRPDDWTELDALARRTYAPETERSRLRGAGAGLTDND